MQQHLEKRIKTIGKTYEAYKTYNIMTLGQRRRALSKQCSLWTKGPSARSFRPADQYLMQASPIFPHALDYPYIPFCMHSRSCLSLMNVFKCLVSIDMLSMCIHVFWQLHVFRTNADMWCVSHEGLSICLHRFPVCFHKLTLRPMLPLTSQTLTQITQIDTRDSTC